MRDVVVLGMLVTLCILALRKAWLGVIGMAVFDYMNPHAYCWGFMTSMPAYQAILIAAFLGLFFAKSEERQRIPSDWRVPAFYFLWLYFLFTTSVALVPAYAWPKFIEVSKIYAPLILTVLLITSREKLFWLLCTMAGSIGLLAVKGGIWAIGTGFSNRVWGPPGTQYGGNNEFAIVTLMMIPLLIAVGKEFARRRSRLAPLISYAAVPICFAAAICSWSRGAMLTAAVVLTVILWDSKRKWLLAPVAAVGIVLLIQQLPDEYFGRMHTIETYEEDKSAMGRIEVWTDGWNYAIRHPITGAGFNGWLMVSQRDWHNSYVEMFSEHGFIAFFIWLSLLIGSITSLTRILKLVSKHPEMAWAVDFSKAIRLSLVAYMTGTIFLGLSYWSVMVQLVFCAVLVKKFALEQLQELGVSPAVRPGLAPRAART